MINTEIFHPAFFGYKNVPDSIELNDLKLIPVKSLRLKYHGKSQSVGAFCVENIRSLCNLLGIELHRPVRGLYCIEERYIKFFDRLYQVLSNSGSFIKWNTYYYDSNCNLVWSIYNFRTDTIHREVKCDGNTIKGIFQEVMI